MVLGHGHPIDAQSRRGPSAARRPKSRTAYCWRPSRSCRSPWQSDCSGNDGAGCGGCGGARVGDGGRRAVRPRPRRSLCRWLAGLDARCRLKTDSRVALALKTRFPDAADDGTVDVLVLGESSARGIPYHEWLSVAEIVAWKLREAFPDRRFPVEYRATPGLTLDKVHFWMGSLERRPDLVILYAGHNEFQMRYDWGHSALHYTDETPPTRVTLRELRPRAFAALPAHPADGGIYRMTLPPTRSARRQLVDVPAYTEAEYAARLHDFRTRLEAMAAYCERVGALVVLVIPPGNDADFEPNRSFLPAETSRAERDEFSRAFGPRAGSRRPTPTRGSRPIGHCWRASPGSPRPITGWPGCSRRGPSRGGQPALCRRPRPRRVPDAMHSDFQDAYREIAVRHPRAILIDGPAVLRGLSPRGTVGDNFFTDGLHPSLIGYTGLAQAILQGLHARRAFGWAEDVPVAGRDPVRLRRAFRHGCEEVEGDLRLRSVVLSGDRIHPVRPDGSVGQGRSVPERRRSDRGRHPPRSGLDSGHREKNPRPSPHADLRRLEAADQDASSR